MISGKSWKTREFGRKEGRASHQPETSRQSIEGRKAESVHLQDGSSFSLLVVVYRTGEHQHAYQLEVVYRYYCRAAAHGTRSLKTMP